MLLNVYIGYMDSSFDWDGYSNTFENSPAERMRIPFSLTDSGYDVLNTVNCKQSADPVLWNKVRQAFAKHFPNIKGV